MITNFETREIRNDWLAFNFLVMFLLYFRPDWSDLSFFSYEIIKKLVNRENYFSKLGVHICTDPVNTLNMNEN